MKISPLLLLGGVILLSRQGLGSPSSPSHAGSSSPTGNQPPASSPSPPRLPSLTPINLNDAGAYQVIDVPGLSGRNFFESRANISQALDWLQTTYSLPAGAAQVSPYSGFLAPQGAAVVTFEGEPFRVLLV